MIHGRKNALRRWELALLLGVAAALLLGTALSGEQAALAGRVVRLHVIGASDSQEDQAVKLQVRDAVLSQAEPWLEGAGSREEAAAVLAEHLPELARAGAEAAGEKVTASIEENAWFPTKAYGDFALPTGRYTALKVTVGAGEGRNWWCVVFPPLCMGCAVETAEEAGQFSPGQAGLITGESGPYELRFKLLELWNGWTDRGEG